MEWLNQACTLWQPSSMTAFNTWPMAFYSTHEILLVSFSQCNNFLHHFQYFLLLVCLCVCALYVYTVISLSRWVLVSLLMCFHSTFMIFTWEHGRSDGENCTRTCSFWKRTGQGWRVGQHKHIPWLNCTGSGRASPISQVLVALNSHTKQYFLCTGVH